VAPRLAANDALAATITKTILNPLSSSNLVVLPWNRRSFFIILVHRLGDSTPYFALI
jgi:hypothetical protein